jgi:hypothetical protein
VQVRHKQGSDSRAGDIARGYLQYITRPTTIGFWSGLHKRKDTDLNDYCPRTHAASSKLVVGYLAQRHGEHCHPAPRQVHKNKTATGCGRKESSLRGAGRNLGHELCRILNNISYNPTLTTKSIRLNVYSPWKSRIIKYNIDPINLKAASAATLHNTKEKVRISISKRDIPTVR